MQLKQAVRYSFFLDSYNRSANQTDTATNTGNVRTYVLIIINDSLVFVHVHVY